MRNATEAWAPVMAMATRHPHACRFKKVAIVAATPAPYQTLRMPSLAFPSGLPKAATCGFRPDYSDRTTFMPTQNFDIMRTF
jgi:hypothetical protein